MAISPQKLMSELNKTDLKIVDEIDSAIEVHLRRSFQGDAVEISINNIIPMNCRPTARQLQLALNRYKETGWDVRSESRDGSDFRGESCPYTVHVFVEQKVSFTEQTHVSQ